jgi:4-alpha-glucanotransferase
LIFAAGGDLTVKFRVHALVQSNHTVAVSGGIPALGSWDPSKALALTSLSSSVHGADVVVKYADAPFDYKYVVLDKENRVVAWEDGSNRRFIGFKRVPFSAAADTAGSEEKTQVVISQDRFRRGFYWRGAGVAVPVFSLRTGDGFGVGEFSDIKKLTDLSVKIGLRMIQLLPVNDTSCFLTWRDSYPYSSLSVFALHPIYLRLQSLTTDKATLEKIHAEAAQLNALRFVDYEAVMAAKNKFIGEIYSASSAKFLADPAFVQWKAENKHWLVPYAVFCNLRDTYKTTAYTTWPDKHKTMSPDQIEKLASELGDAKLGQIFFVQYNLHLQLSEASQYAASHGIGLKGDLPIGVNLLSVDSWQNPDLYHLDMSTGAPPDQFSEDGQNWGFPTYDWEKMAQNGYLWWRQRLTQMAKYFHAFRIDHVLGFFRIWEIPREYESGLMGHFNPSIPIHRAQLEREGLWDLERLCDPYVKSHLVEKYFVERSESEYVCRTFFEEYAGRLRFRFEFNTEGKILAYTERLPTDTEEARAWKSRLERGLTQLIKNVVLLRTQFEPEGQFYPRVNMFKTSSFSELESSARETLYRLYIDYYYGERQEAFWGGIGASRLPVLKDATRMLICAEDLGMVPKCVEPVLNDLGMLGLRIQRMPPDPKQEFGLPHQYAFMTVCTPSSHDTSTIRGWWGEDRGKTQWFYNTVLGEGGAAPEHCEDWLVEKIIAQHLHSPSMWAIFPLQDFFGLQWDLRVSDANDEKINEPSNPKHYWRYRMHVSVEDLMKHHEWINRLKNMVAASGRLTN